MLDLLLAGGWLILPLAICSILGLAIIIERSWQLRRSKIIPQKLIQSLLTDIKERSISSKKLTIIEESSALGSLLVLIIRNISSKPEVLIGHIEESGAKIIHQLEKHLNMLGTIATITPLLGLLGTVVGMIDVFSVITEQGTGNPNTLAGGISQALITTAVGLCIAIPCFIFHRMFQRKIDELSFDLEHEALYFYEEVKEHLHNLKAKEQIDIKNNSKSSLQHEC